MYIGLDSLNIFPEAMGCPSNTTTKFRQGSLCNGTNICVFGQTPSTNFSSDFGIWLVQNSQRALLACICVFWGYRENLHTYAHYISFLGDTLAYKLSWWATIKKEIKLKNIESTNNPNKTEYFEMVLTRGHNSKTRVTETLNWLCIHIHVYTNISIHMHIYTYISIYVQICLHELCKTHKNLFHPDI